MQDVIDLGRLNPGQRKNHSFAIRNSGTEPLRIARISSSCGCIVLSDGWKEKPIPPGQETQVTLQLVTDDQAGGLRTQTVAIETNDPSRPVKPVKINFVVKPDYGLAVVPAKLDFERPVASSRPKQLVTLISPYPQKLPVRRIRASHPALTVTEVETNAAQNAVKYEVQITSDPPPGRFDATVTFETDIGDVVVPVTAVLPERFRCEPDVIILRDGDAGGTALVVSASAEDAPFILKNVNDPKGILGALYSADLRHEHRVALKVDRGPAPGVFKGTLELTTDRYGSKSIDYYVLQR